MRQPTLMRPIVAVLLVACGLIAAYLLLRPVPRTQAGTAPDFRLASTGGGRVTLSDYRGHPILLNFFATWCTPCREELPVIWRAQRKHRDLVTLLVDERESSSQVRDFLRGLSVALPALLDVDGTVAAQYAIFAQPETVWIAPSGRVRWVSHGPIDAWVIHTRYRQLKSNA